MTITRLLRLIPAAVLLAAGLVIAPTTSFVGCPATANAEPVWDIEKFDDCLDALNDGLNESQNSAEQDHKDCCRYSGGEWNEAQKTCQAPPGASVVVRPPGGDLPTAPIQPSVIAPPPPDRLPPVGPVQPVQPPMAG